MPSQSATPRQARYRDLRKVHLQHLFCAAALNLIRLHAYWNDHPTYGPHPHQPRRPARTHPHSVIKN